MEAIINGIAEAVFAMDNNLKLFILNTKAKELFNIKDSIKTMTLLEATHSTELVKIARKAISDKTSFETKLTFHSGKERHFQVFASPLAKANDYGSKVNGVVLVVLEITRLIKLENIRKNFVANVSHELRTPIQLIKGFSETLLDSVTVSKKMNKKQLADFLEIIYKNAGTMENLTNDLLMLAELENNSVNITNIKEFNINSLIAEAVSSLEARANRKQIEIVVSCQEDLKGKLYGSFIIQALINLIDNSIKYSPEKTTIEVNAYPLVCETGGQNQIIFEVKDNGIGISPEHLERIFERFYRADRARSREAGGTGLGLSIVRHIALLHKGSAEVESYVGEGSVFRIKIPA
jgi:two-component system phosphate regulon sensor histidine kinase PhoR